MVLWFQIPPCLSLVSAVCCQVEKSLRRADHLYRGVLPNVICPMSVIAKTRKGRSWPEIKSKRHEGEVVSLYVPCGITKTLVSKYERLTNQQSNQLFMQHISGWNGNCSTFCNPKVHYNFDKSPKLDPTMGDFTLHEGPWSCTDVCMMPYTWFSSFRRKMVPSKRRETLTHRHTSHPKVPETSAKTL